MNRPQQPDRDPGGSVSSPEPSPPGVSNFFPPSPPEATSSCPPSPLGDSIPASPPEATSSCPPSPPGGSIPASPPEATSSCPASPLEATGSCSPSPPKASSSCPLSTTAGSSLGPPSTLGGSRLGPSSSLGGSSPDPPGGSLEQQLAACRAQVQRLEQLLSRSQMLCRSTATSNRELRLQVEKLSREIHDRKKRAATKNDAVVQTEDSPAWSQSDDYCSHQNYHSNDVPVHAGSTDHEIDGFTPSAADQFEADTSVQTSIATAENGQNRQDCDAGFVQHSEEADGPSLAESLRATAEAAVSQTGFTYDENTGLYYDHSTGFYYDSQNQLYYDANTGIYYYCDADSGRYLFHSRIDLGVQQATTSQPNQKNSGKRKRRAEYQDLYAEEQMASTSSTKKKAAKRKKKAKMDTNITENTIKREELFITENGYSGQCTYTAEASLCVDDSDTEETDNEPEDGELSDSEMGDDSRGGESSGSSTDFEDYGNKAEDPRLFINSWTGHWKAAEGSRLFGNSWTDPWKADAEHIWPPCIRVVVIRSPVLETGSLFIITAVMHATIGRAIEMEHTIQIPEAGVSKFHAEVYFDHDIESYVLVDQGSQNGTIINGNQILQPKMKCEPYAVTHGDEVIFGETVLSFHVHPGNETCGGCEPGQVRAHLGLTKKEESYACSGAYYLSKAEKELLRRKELKQIRVKYGLQNCDYEENQVVKNPKYKDRAGNRRQTVGSEGSFQRDDAPASVHVEINDANKGHRMLKKMGWKKGEGLGKRGGGMKDPIQLQLRKKKAGLGAAVATSIEDTLIESKNQHNWEKARERFTEMFPDAKFKDVPKATPWVKEALK